MVSGKISDDDAMEWPDGTWCHRYELSDFDWKSDDYIVHPEGSESWKILHRDQYVD